MIRYEEIFENNKRWIGEKLSDDPGYFDRLAGPQDPDFLYIGCSDSRVTAEEMMGMKPGEVFVHRNIANIVSNTDLNALSVIDYAVSHLSVKHVIVCGHYNCGGVQAAMQSRNLGLLNPWLRNIRDVYRLHSGELNAIPDQDARYRRLIEINVEEQCINVIKTAAVQESYIRRGYPHVHGWVFDISSGRIIDLNLNFTEILKGIQEIYDLTGNG